MRLIPTRELRVRCHCHGKLLLASLRRLIPTRELRVDISGHSCHILDTSLIPTRELRVLLFFPRLSQFVSDPNKGIESSYILLSSCGFKLVKLIPTRELRVQCDVRFHSPFFSPSDPNKGIESSDSKPGSVDQDVHPDPNKGIESEVNVEMAETIRC